MDDSVPIVAQAVRVSIYQDNGLDEALLIVAEPDPTKAREIIEAELAPGDRVIDLHPLPKGCLEAFDLEPGQFTRWLGGGMG